MTREVGLVIAALVAVAAPTHAEIASVDTLSIDGVTYLSLNDLLRPLAGIKQFGTILDVGRVQLGDVEITLLDGSPIVASEARTWSLMHPVLKRDGMIWVPEIFLSSVLDALTPHSVTVRRGLMFVDLVPGRVDSVTVYSGDATREIVIHGGFPVPPVTTTSHDRLVLDLDGCFVDDYATGSVADSMVLGWRISPTPAGASIQLLLGNGVTSYDWLSTTSERLRLVVGTDASDLKPLVASLRGGGVDVRRIVVDAGHGGDDAGARLGSGRFEKWVNLEAARLVADSLRTAGYEVLLTRNEDRILAPEERAEFANESKADLFLSIEIEHGDGDGRPDVVCIIHDSAGEEGRTRVVAGYRLTPWSQVQKSHLEESDHVALCLLSALTRRGVRTPSLPLRVPLRVMEGLAMPAVELLISEAAVKAERRDRALRRVASAIVDGVRLYGGEVDG